MNSRQLVHHLTLFFFKTPHSKAVFERKLFDVAMHAGRFSVLPSHLYISGTVSTRLGVKV